MRIYHITYEVPGIGQKTADIKAEDHAISGGQLTIFYWDENGIDTTTVAQFQVRSVVHWYFEEA